MSQFCEIIEPISIHALRKESDSPDLTVQSAVDISIHALRKESDHIGPDLIERLIISIHALRKESDPMVCFVGLSAGGFQSTLSVRRATVSEGEQSHDITHFNPRSP